MSLSPQGRARRDFDSELSALLEQGSAPMNDAMFELLEWRYERVCNQRDRAAALATSHFAVAERAGVSSETVRKVLNGGGRQSTRIRVLTAVADTGYQYKPRTRRARTLQGRAE